MPIQRLVQDESFDPELVSAMGAAFVETLHALQSVDRNDPLNDIITKRIIEVARTGERNPQRIRERVLQSLNRASDPHGLRDPAARAAD